MSMEGLHPPPTDREPLERSSVWGPHLHELLWSLIVLTMNRKQTL
jgi:hypothetical protein